MGNPELKPQSRSGNNNNIFLHIHTIYQPDVRLGFLLCTTSFLSVLKPVVSPTISLPRDISYEATPDEIVFFQEINSCGLLCSGNHPFSKVERFGLWYLFRGQDKKADIHSSKMKWSLFTKDKNLALQTAKAHIE